MNFLAPPPHSHPIYIVWSFGSEFFHHQHGHAGRFAHNKSLTREVDPAPTTACGRVDSGCADSDARFSLCKPNGKASHTGSRHQPILLLDPHPPSPLHAFAPLP